MSERKLVQVILNWKFMYTFWIVSYIIYQVLGRTYPASIPSLLQETMDRRASVFLFVLVSPSSNTLYGITIMKRYLIKYMDDLRIPVLASLLTWWAFVLVLGLLGGRSFLTRFGHDIPVVFLIFFILPFTYTIPPLLYQLYKGKWLNAGFLVLVWLSPWALYHIPQFILIIK